MKLLTILAAGSALFVAAAAHAQGWGYGVNGFAQGLAQGLAITNGQPYFPPPMPQFYQPYYAPPQPVYVLPQRCAGYTDIAGVWHRTCY